MSEETEREALAVLLHATHCGCKAYSGIGDEDNVYEEMADAMIAAGFRCLSESEPYFCVRCGERFSSLGDAHYPHSAALRRSE